MVILVTIIVFFARSDISDVEYRLDKEGKDYHHHEGFAQLYRAEVSFPPIGRCQIG